MGATGQGADATDGRWLTIPRTLSFVFKDDQVLLMKRAVHKRVFPNQYNGLGGHIERDEDPYTSALREIEEESGLHVHSLALRAVHHIDTGAKTGIILFVFSAVSDTFDFVSQSDEGTLHWVPVDKLAEYDLVEDIPLILPRLLEKTPTGAPLSAHVSYNASDEIQIRYWIEN